MSDGTDEHRARHETSQADPTTSAHEEACLESQLGYPSVRRDAQATRMKKFSADVARAEAAATHP